MPRRLSALHGSGLATLLVLSANTTQVLAGEETTIVVPNQYESVEGYEASFSAAFGFPLKAHLVYPASEFAALPQTHRWIIGYRLRPDESASP